MRIHVMLLGFVAGVAIALTPTHVFAQQMPGQMQDLTERERLEQMREHMVDGMRRMAVRMDAVQARIAAIDRGEPDAAPMPESMGMGMGQGMGQGMGMGQGHAMGQGRGMGQGMKASDGSGPGCPNMPAAEDAAEAGQEADT